MKVLAIGLVLGLGLVAYFLGAFTSEKTITPSESFFDRLGTEEIVQMQIEADLTDLIENRAAEIEQEGVLQVVSTSGLSESHPVKISLRGKTRREVCSFPPLRLNFKKGLLEEAGLADHDKYKLVTHCVDDSELVLKEYMAYQLYNQLTKYSFRARLVELTYVDRGGKIETFQQHALLLENYGEMAARLGAERMPDKLPKNTRVPNEAYQRLVLFQYMIGNTDWNLFKQHNIKWLRTEEGAIPVPYDFDFSGLVNAPYAKPHPSLPIDSVRQRYLQWRGQDKSQLAGMLQELREKQADLVKVCQEFETLSASEKEEMMNYLNDFFNTVDQTDLVAE